MNATTMPGAYPVKVSFVYNDGQGGSFVDDQVITLLVFSQPSVEVNVYMPPPPFSAGQPGQLPLHLVNTGKSAPGIFLSESAGIGFLGGLGGVALG